MSEGSPLRRRALSTARVLDITSPLCAEAYAQDLRFRRHQQHTCKRYGDPNNARGLATAHLPPSTRSASTTSASTTTMSTPHLIKLSFSLSIVDSYFYFCRTRYWGAMLCKLTLQAIDYTCAALTLVRRIDYTFTASTSIRRIDYNPSPR
jgi:hypothetical protein